jgi:hypothetical protein
MSRSLLLAVLTVSGALNPFSVVSAQEPPTHDVTALADFAQPYYHTVERPEGSAGQLLRFTVTLLYPTTRP